MPEVNSIDDLSDEAWPPVEKALKAFRAKKRKTRDDEHELYAVLTNAGLSSEYADEFINLEMQVARGEV